VLRDECVDMVLLASEVGEADEPGRRLLYIRGAHVLEAHILR
jgi:hypothetical protein